MKSDQLTVEFLMDPMRYHEDQPLSWMIHVPRVAATGKERQQEHGKSSTLGDFSIINHPAIGAPPFPDAPCMNYVSTPQQFPKCRHKKTINGASVS